MAKDKITKAQADSRYFRSLAGRHDPSLLLKDIATQSCLLPEFATAKRYSTGVTPWGLAAIARDSIALGSRHQRSPVTTSTVLDLSYVFNGIGDNVDGDFDLLSLVRYGYEQFPYQSSLKHDLARSYLLLEVVKIPKFDGKLSDWNKILGIPAKDAVTATFGLYMYARMNQGRLPSEPLSTIPYWSIMGKYLSPLRAIEITRERLTATVDEARGVYWERNAGYKGSFRYAYNPLSSTPLIDLGEGYLIAPQPHLILNSMSPESLYYLGLREGEDDCGSELGRRVEAYTGMLFSGISGLKVHEEQPMHSKQNIQSIDWIIITDDIVLLIECKGAFMSLLGRSGVSQEVLKRSEDYVGHAYGQINRTHDEIKKGSNAYPAIRAIIPSLGNRTVYGLVVTGGPFHAANSSLVKNRLRRKPNIPTLVASVNDVELLASLTAVELRDFLKEIHTNPMLANVDIGTAIRSKGLWREHPLLKQVYRKVIFPTRKLSRQDRKAKKKEKRSVAPQRECTLVPSPLAGARDYDIRPQHFSYADHFVDDSASH